MKKMIFPFLLLMAFAHAKSQGVFINKSENGLTKFGLGIKPQNLVSIIEGLKLTKFFFKKVSP